MSQPYADLELSLSARQDGSYIINAEFTTPDAVESTLLATDTVQITIDQTALQTYASDATAYGKALSAALFNAQVGQEFRNARGIADNRGVPLRLRLRLPNELHTIRWETLRDPGLHQLLATNDRRLISRYVPSDDVRPIRRGAPDNLRALVAIANPTNLSEFEELNLAPIDVAAETAMVSDSFGAQATLLHEAGPVTINAISQHLRDEYDVLYIVAHGMLDAGAPYLWLEGDDRNADVVSGSALVNALRELSHVPPLVMLVSCESGGNSLALGPQLAAAGAPAVVAMHEQVSMETMRQFLPAFFTALQRNGLIDQAMSAARSAVRTRPDWWMPVLFLRLRDGRLWQEEDAPASTPQTVQNIHNNAPNQGAQGSFHGPVTFNQQNQTNTGNRSVNVGGSSSGPIVTGDGNTVHHQPDSKRRNRDSNT